MRSKITSRKRDIFIINQFEPHKITFKENEVFERYVIQIHPSFIYDSSSEMTDLSHCFYSRTTPDCNRLSLLETEKSYILSLIERLKEYNTFGDDILKNNIITEILIFINRWLYQLKQGHFFDTNNSRYIEYVGYSIIVLSLWYGVQELAGSYVRVNFFESNPEILESLSSTAIEAGSFLSYTFSIDIVMLFIGVLVWIIGRVFKYGTYLQEEYDQTV